MRPLKILPILVFLLISSTLFAASQVDVIGYTPFAFERATVTTATVSQLNATYKAAAGAVFITVETNNIRYQIDGTNPDVNTGHLVVPAAYQNIWFNDPASIKAFRAIAIGGNATLQITYYRRN
jgi:hypothetical protein